MCCGFTLGTISFFVLLLKDITAYDMHGEPRLIWVALKQEWIPSVGRGWHIQPGMSESFVHLEILRVVMQSMVYAKEFRDAFYTYQCTLSNEWLWKYIFTGIFMAAKELLHSSHKSCNDSSGIISDPMGHQEKASYAHPLQISNSRCFSIWWTQRNKMRVSITCLHPLDSLDPVLLTYLYKQHEQSQFIIEIPCWIL